MFAVANNMEEYSMGTKINSITVAIATFTMLFTFTQSQASQEGHESSAQLIANLDGYHSCENISNNSNVMEVRVRRPTYGQPVILPLGSQSIRYEISHGKVISWSFIPDYNEPEFPINSVIIDSKNGHKSDKSDKSDKSGKSNKRGSNAGARAYHFGDQGATEDEGETGQGKYITKIRFCYGLVDDAPPVQAFEDKIPNCNVANTGISCPTGTDLDEPMLFIGLSLLNPNFDPSSQSEDEKDSWCTCGSLVLSECDPAADAGTENACNLPEEDEGEEDYPEGYSGGYSVSSENSDDDVADGVVPRVPVLIQAVETPDSYVCRVRAGVRRCYSH
jgi:hypothetical protein